MVVQIVQLGGETIASRTVKLRNCILFPWALWFASNTKKNKHGHQIQKILATKWKQQPKTQLLLHMLRFWAVLLDFLWFLFQFARLSLILSLYLSDSLSMFFCLCAIFFIWYLCVLIVRAEHCFDSSVFFLENLQKKFKLLPKYVYAKGTNLSTWMRYFSFGISVHPYSQI